MLNREEVGIDYKPRLKEISDEWQSHIIQFELNRVFDKEEFDREQEAFFGKSRKI